MAKHNASNERVKRDYFHFLSEAKGRDTATVDRIAASLARSSKDLEEHEYAVRSVAEALAPHCSSMNVPESPFVLHLPNVMHLVLITVVLSFSELILYEAVLTYVGVGVDPTTSSFGGMINLARSEMSRDPVVWWSFAAAFGFMVSLVLAANLFADGVRDAFDPKARSTRPRIVSKQRKAVEHA